MKGTDHFKRTIQMYLEQRAEEDTLFAKSYRNPAKNIDDCVTYINDGVVCVAVSAPADGLSDADAALISDIVTSQTDYSLSQVRIIEVKP